MYFETLSNPVLKEYFALSPNASIEKLKNGCFIVHNKVTGCESYGFQTYPAALEMREIIAHRYKPITAGHYVPPVAG